MTISAIPVYFSYHIAAVVTLETIAVESIGMFFVFKRHISLFFADKYDFIIGGIDGACFA